MNTIEAWDQIRAHALNTRGDVIKALWEAQCLYFPRSRMVDSHTVVKTWVEIQKSEYNKTLVLRILASCLQYPFGVFYETEHGYRGFRYGVEPHEYISGFGIV
jgi:hypothetical protein